MTKIVVQILRAPAGGIRKHVLDILENIQGNEIKQIFITNTKDSDVDLTKITALKNVEIYHLDIEDKPGLTDVLNLVKIFKLLKNRKVDVLHGHGAKGGLYARLLAHFLKAKCIYTPHGGSLHRVHGKIKNIVYDVIEKCMIPFTDVFLFESHYSSDIFSINIGNPGYKKVINYNGVDLSNEFSLVSYQAGQKLKLASFGLLRHLKGHDIFIETCHLMKEQNIPFEYSIYGDGECRDILLSLISKYELNQNVFIKDYCSTVVQEMLKYDFIVHPSRFESFGYVPVEAMSAKVPVIVSSEGGLREIVDEASGYISYDNTPESYMKIIEKIYQGDVQLPSKIENAYIRVSEKFSKNAMLSGIKEIYLS